MVQVAVQLSIPYRILTLRKKYVLLSHSSPFNSLPDSHHSQPYSHLRTVRKKYVLLSHSSPFNSLPDSHSRRPKSIKAPSHSFNSLPDSHQYPSEPSPQIKKNLSIPYRILTTTPVTTTPVRPTTTFQFPTGFSQQMVKPTYYRSINHLSIPYRILTASTIQ